MHKRIIGLLCLLNISFVFANPLFSSFLQHNYLQLSFGIDQSSYDARTNSGLDGYPDVHINNTVGHSSVMGLEVGHEFQRAQQGWLSGAQLSVNYLWYSGAKINGQVQQYSDPELINYNYNYSLMRQQLSLLSRIFVYQWSQVKLLGHQVASLAPFVEFSAGYEWDHVSGYSETPLPGVHSRDNPAFGTTLGYNTMGGFGARLQFNAHWWGLLRADWSHTKPTDTNSTNLQTTLNGNNVLLSVGYLF